MKIAYDCQGGDNAPEAIVRGALKAAEVFNCTPYFYGDADRIKVIDGVDPDYVIHCSESIEGDESPTMAIRKKKDSAIVRALFDLKEDRVDGVISAGSTGALLAGGMFIVSRQEGVERAALPVVLTLGSQTKLLLDVGANMDASPEMLLSFAKMGADYLSHVEGVENPSVGLLNVGTEKGKGNRQSKDAYELFEGNLPNFYGNVEARDVLFKSSDVIVCDGFAGNVMLKSMEGVIGYVQHALKSGLKREDCSPEVQAWVGKFAREALGALDYTRYGGVPLLGLKKPLFKAHGSSDEEAIVSATKALIKMIKE
ncbi:phosphate acyltransferase PlsX [Aedoeadaptatus coxii]|uniref:phosphate acyltransferase PlsX n=1 Tax=Aedoeadaptatus coxii TaxID=755172 RepID=UPI002AD48A40|nr:phosphate acyltransferase PlsX [Peptoniphilus coxii]